jgi:hypothetical protein
LQSANDDRFLYWPVIVAVTGPLVFLLVWIPIAILGGPIVILFLLGPILALIPMSWAGAGVFAAMMCAIFVYERAWRRLVSTLILPLAVLIAGFNLGATWRAAQAAGDYAHFFLVYPPLLADVEKLPAGQSRFKAWDWASVWSREIGIAYDEKHPSEAWKQSAREVGVAGYGYRPLYGHFYLVDLE